MDENWWELLESLGPVLKGELIFFAKKVLKKIIRMTKNPEVYETQNRYRITEVVHRSW
jgi:hypothetical protein